MKSKAIIIFSILLISLISSSSIKAKEENEYNFVLEKEIKLSDNAHSVFINNNLYLTYSNNTINVISSSGNLTIEDHYKSYYYSNNTLYICGSSTLYIVNLGLLSYKSVITNMNLNDIYIDEYIYLVGEDNDNPSLSVLSLEGEITKTKTFEGSGFATIQTIDKVGEFYFITGVKDAFFENSEFLKVGNKGDVKSFVFVIDQTLKKVNDYYFNEDASLEEITCVGVDKNYTVLLQTHNNTYLYQFDYDLKLVKYICLNDVCKYHYIPNILDKQLLIKEELNKFTICLYEDNMLQPIFEQPHTLKSMNFIVGGIVLGFNDKINIYSEYHLDRKDTLVLSKASYDYDSTNHFKVLSFFENLQFNLESYNPYHTHMMSGNYQATYISKNKLGSSVVIKTDVIVKDFVNIIDGGVYNVNTKIQFFGKACLNGENINNGHTLTEPGGYELVLTNVNGVTKTYYFEVVNNYYKDNDHYVIDVDYVLNKEESIDIEFEFSDTSKLQHFIVNNKKYTNFSIDGNKVTLTINALSEYGYEHLTINQVVFSDMTIDINKSITTLTKKTKPNFNITSSSNGSYYEILISYEDIDNSLIDIYYVESNNIKTSTYLKPLSSKVNTCCFYLTYELGDGTCHEEKLFELVGQDIKYQMLIKEEGVIINIYPSKTLKSININSNDIYKSSSDNINVYLILFTVVSSILIIITTVIILIIKRKRRKVNRI